MNKLSERLKELREKKKWSQCELARQSKIDQAIISRCESKENVMTVENIIKACKALNCTADYLLGLIDEEKIN